jgi:hypothetical protein
VEEEKNEEKYKIKKTGPHRDVKINDHLNREQRINSLLSSQPHSNQQGKNIQNQNG